MNKANLASYQHGRNAGAAPPSWRVAAARRSRLKVLGLALTLGLVLAAAGILISWLRPAATAPTYLPLVVERYQSLALGVVACAGRDADTVQSALTSTSSTRAEPSTREAWLAGLAQLKNHAGQIPAVIYCKAVAARDGHGAWCILPADADPLQPDTWLPLRTILERVRACPAPHKLVVLDLAAPPHGCKIGILDNDIAAGLSEELKGVPDETRLVLCASAAGQETITSPALCQSLFAHYWQEGLRGAADSYGAGDHDGHITVHELAGFLQARVDRAAGGLRQQRQTPMLLGTAPDFVLCHKPDPVSAPNPLQAHPYPAWLRGAWQWRDRVWHDGSFADAPRLFQQIQAQLLQAEAAWRSGAEQVVAQIETGFDSNRQEFVRQMTIPWPSTVSLVQETPHVDTARIADITSALSQVSQELLEVSPPNRQRRLEYRLAELRKKHPQAEPRDWQAAAWAWIREQKTPTPHDVHAAAALLSRSEAPRYQETVILLQLAELAGRIEPNAWPAALIGQMIQVTHQEAELLFGGHFAPCGQDSLARASQARHDGTVTLLAHHFTDADDAKVFFKEAEVQLGRSSTQSERWCRTARHLDELMALAAWVSPAAGDLPALSLAFHECRHRFDDDCGKQGEEELAKREANVESWAHLWTQQDAIDEQQCKDLESKSKLPEADAKLAARLEICLAQPLPHLNATRRIALNESLVELDRRLLDKIRQLDQEDNKASRSTSSPSDVDQNAAMAKRQQVVDRARDWVNWLAVAEVASPDIQAAQQALDRAAHEPGAQTRSEAEAALRRLATVSLPQRFEEAADDATRAWLMSFFPPGAAYRCLDSLPQMPVLRCRRQERQRLQSWLASWHRYQAHDYRGLVDLLPGSGAAASFSAQAAKDLEPAPGAERFITLRPERLPERLSATQPTQRMLLEIERAAGGPLTVGFFPAKQSGLALGPTGLDYAAIDLQSGPLVHRAPIQVEWRPSLTTSQTAAPGFLARARCEGRSYHAIIPVAIAAARPEVQLLVSTNPKEPQPTIGEIAIRPTGEPQTIFLFLKNPTPQPRLVTLQARAGDLLLPGMPKELLLQTQETRRVIVGDALTAYQAPLECGSPLELRVVEAAAPHRVLDAKVLPLRLVTESPGVRVVGFQGTIMPAARNQETVMRLVGARYVKPTAKYPLKLEVAQAPEGASLEVRLIPGSHDDGASTWVKRFPQPRDRGITLGMAGGLVFAAHDADWRLDLDTRTLRGRCQVQATLIDSAGKEVRRERRDLIIDDDPPSMARVIRCPRKAEKGTTIYVEAEGRDDESGIEAAAFFVGPAQGDQVPDGTVSVPGTPLAADNTTWSARVTLPLDSKGPTPITVRFVNAVGLARCVTQLVEVTDVDPALLEPGKIEGKVLEGTRPQPGLTVVLKDAAGQEKARTQTRPDGTFAFTDLPAVRYQLFCVKPETGRRGQASVSVTPGRTAAIDVHLSF